MGDWEPTAPRPPIVDKVEPKTPPQGRGVPYAIMPEVEERWYWPIDAELLHADDVNQTVFIDDPTIGRRTTGVLVSFEVRPDRGMIVELRLPNGRVELQRIGMKTRVNRLIDIDAPDRPRSVQLIRWPYLILAPRGVD